MMEKIFMKIFEQEKLDGLEEKIKASASVSYASYVEPCTIPSKISAAQRFTYALP